MVTRRTVLSWAAAAALSPGVALAAGQAELRLETKTVFAGQTGQLTVRVSGGDPSSVPEVGAGPGVVIGYNGMSQNTTVVGGRVSQFIQFRFSFTISERGTHVLGPARVRTVDSRGQSSEILTSTLKIDVEEAPEIDLQVDGIDVSAGFDHQQAWEGQVVLYTYTLRTRVDLAGARWLGHPQEGLMQPRDGRPERREYRIQDERGIVAVDETQVPFVLTGSGARTWHAPNVEVDVRRPDQGRRRFFGLFGGRTERLALSAGELALDVKPLPPAPEGFSGLVGDFALNSRLDTRSSTVGGSVTWTLHIDGNGNLEGFQLPDPGEIPGARLYDGSARGAAVLRKNGYRSTLRIDRSVVPTAIGRLELPPIELIVFSPSKGEYVTLTAATDPLAIREGEDGAVSLKSFGDEAPPSVAPPTDDGVRPIWTSGPGRRLPWVRWMPVPLALAALPAAGILVEVAGRRAAARLQAATASTHREATPMERLAQLPSTPEARLAALDDALRAALAAHADVPPARLDRLAVFDTLPDALGQEARAVSEALDRARFAGGVTGNELEARVRAVVSALEVP